MNQREVWSISLDIVYCAKGMGRRYNGMKRMGRKGFEPLVRAPQAES